MIWYLYMLMILGIPILYCILLNRLRKRIPKGCIIISILMGIFIFRTIVSLPIYILAPAISDSSYELFKTCLLALIQFYIYGIIIIGLYITYYILMKKERKFIIFIIITTVTLTILTCFLGTILFKERERLDDKYLEMYEIDVNNSLVGLSKGEVVERLGKPGEIYEYTNTNKESYSYNAGNRYVGIIWGNHNIFTTRYGYTFTVYFDEMDKVNSTSMKYIP